MQPFAITAEYQGVRIEPLTLAHAPEYRAALLPDPETMALFTEYPASLDLPDIENYIRRRIAPGNIAHAVYAGDTFAGSSSYLDIRPEHRGIEIGHTWYSPDYRGTSLNPIVKLLMIEAAFGQFGAMRIQFKTGHKNLRSQKAMRNIGLVEEGTLRNHILLPDGTWRHSVFFSVIPEEWPAMRARLLELIETRPAWRTADETG